MLYTIKNDRLEVSADTFGAELHSVRLDGKEYLWQCGDAWKRYAPILFPFICSPKDRAYTAKGQPFKMKGNHGFARDMEFAFKAQTENSLSFVLTENADSHYRLRSWLPLNSENYKQYQESESLVERIQILERVLVGNILSFLKGVDIYLEEQLAVHVTDITGQRAVTYKKVKLMAFDIEFKANIQLPQYIGIGKNASIGCGVLTKITN